MLSLGRISADGVKLLITKPYLQQSLYVITKLSSSWTAAEIRTAFIDFFKSNQHEFYPPSSVIPDKGSGTFFTNAGMNQFKPIFLGATLPDTRLSSIKRAVNSQKCIRLSGKHNDLEDVGLDTTHHTFFEMLGNWSFGDYFKKEAMQMAWTLMTEVYKIPHDRLYVTYFGGEPSLSLPADIECKELWLEIGVDASRVLPGAMKDNFWEMGDTGPCGPCSEIHYDFVGERNASHLVNADHPDVVELWNLVFMQYNRLGTNEIGLLPRQHIDTGMGLERLVSVLQNKRSNYDTDLFKPIIDTISKCAQCGSYTGSMSLSTDISYRIVADHARMMCISIADGIMPANQGLDGLSMKLRQIMYRMFRHQRVSLGSAMSSSMLVEPVVEILGDAFPELQDNYQLIKSIVKGEEEEYYERVSDAYTVFSSYVQKYPNKQMLSEEDVNILKNMSSSLDLASELVAEVAADYGLTIPASTTDTNKELSVHSTKHDNSKLASKFLSRVERACIPSTNDSFKYNLTLSEDGTYNWPSCTGKVLAVGVSDELVEHLSADDQVTECVVITDQSCFYAEAGGQAADRGLIFNENCELEVRDVQSHGQHVIHRCQLLTGALQLGDNVTLEIDQAHRTACTLNHTATHLLGHSLRSILSRNIQQSGSSITSEDLNFSFTHQGEISLADLSRISANVNELISNSISLTYANIEYSKARDLSGLVYLPNHVYPSTVRVVGVGDLDSALKDNKVDFSAELCNGTHVANTSDIRKFVITGYSGQNRAMKRLTCLTGAKAIEADEMMTRLQQLTFQLIDDIKQDKQTDTWNERFQRISQIFADSHKLPKVERETLFEQLKQQREAIRRKNNEDARAQLEKSIVGLVKDQNDSSVVIGQLKFNTVPEVAKILRRLSHPLPVVIYSLPNQTSKQHISLVCYCPVSSKDGEWVKSLSMELNAALVQMKGKNMSNLYKMSLPAGTDIDNLSDIVRNVVHSTKTSVLPEH